MSDARSGVLRRARSRIGRPARALPLLLVLLAGLAAPPAAAQGPVRAAERRALEAEFARIAAASGGTGGVPVVHVETGARASLNGGAPFPMLSSDKLLVAHGTGTAATFGGYTIAVNDVGIVTLPDGRGHLAVAVFVRGTTRPVGEAERAIARISRAAYDRRAR